MLTKLTTLTTATLLMAVAITGCKTSQSLPVPQVNPEQVQALAKSPSPPANATPMTSVGVGEASIPTTNSAGEGVPSWAAQVDITGDGAAESATVFWDAEDGMLFAYAEAMVTDGLGSVADAQVLIGVNAKGNPRGMAEGSGFYAVFFDVVEGGAEDAGLFGARFDPAGNVVEAGAIVLDAENDEIAIITAG